MEDAIRTYPPPSSELRVEDIYRDIQLPSKNPWDCSLPYAAINMVSSLDGKIAINGTANPIGGSADRRVMRNIRSRFDAVLRGAGTLRAEKISLGVTKDLARDRLSEGREEQPLDLILSSDIAGLPLDTNLLNVTPGRVAVLVPSDNTSAAREDIQILRMPTVTGGAVDLMQAMQLLKRDHHVHSVLLEGGPTLNHHFVSNNLVNELFLTLAPKLLPANTDAPLTLLHAPRRSHAAPLNLELISTHVAGDEVFLRYTIPAINPTSFR